MFITKPTRTIDKLNFIILQDLKICQVNILSQTHVIFSYKLILDWINLIYIDHQAFIAYLEALDHGNFNNKISYP